MSRELFPIRGCTVNTSRALDGTEHVPKEALVLELQRRHAAHAHAALPALLPEVVQQKTLRAKRPYSRLT